ncbi:4-hydroxy-tetrahydrodipicolinate synthase [Stappia sp. MMSF_3263]|uniref:4-hydroxy-tetrahydrodipicolinate synthase n=1 Tax=Stappia sp. MMSF_3263 TaxID=3046693 RepID=UPI00273FE254|nr:4-hydroxy-tetrahydrodipicolinate synthase [Stappia sp. MMSF_3263]
MDLQRFHGMSPALATPFTANQELDLDRLDTLIEGYLACGVHGISVAGSQGEFFSLDEAEHIALLERCVKAVDGRVPVVAGCARSNLTETRRVLAAAEKIGVDMAMLITPYFVQPNQSELAAHFIGLAGETKLPVLLYNNPPRTSVNIAPQTLVSVMNAAPNVVGIKDSAGDMTQSVEYLVTTDRRALLFSGRDTLTLSMLVNGGHGAVSPACNVFPRLLVKLHDTAVSGDLAEARRISDLLSPLRAAWVLGSFPVVIKEAMTMAGRSAGPARAPVAPLGADAHARLKSVVETIMPEEEALAR